MPAFGKDGIKDLNQSQDKTIWEVVDSNGNVLMMCDNEPQANSLKEIMSKTNQGVTIRTRGLKCL